MALEQVQQLDTGSRRPRCAHVWCSVKGVSSQHLVAMGTWEGADFSLGLARGPHQALNCPGFSNGPTDPAVLVATVRCLGPSTGLEDDPQGEAGPSEHPRAFGVHECTALRKWLKNQ